MSEKRVESYWGERTYETLVENASEIIARFDRERRHLYVNRAITRATGRPASDFVGKTNAELGMPPDLVEAWDRAIDIVLTEAKEQTVEFSFPDPSGGVRWYRSRMVPELDADGDVESVVAVARDITDVKHEEQRRIDEARHAADVATTQRDFLAAAIRATDLCIAVMTGRELRFTVVNPAYERLAAGRPLLGRRYGDVFPQAVAAGREARLLHILETGERWQLDRYPTAAPSDPDAVWDGEVIRLDPIHAGDEPSVGVFIQNVSVQARLEAELRARTALLSAISDTSPDAIFAKDREGRITFANPATLRLAGKGADEVIGRTDSEFLADKAVAARVMENDQAIMLSGTATQIEERVPYPDGTECIWLSTKVPYRDTDGTVIGLLGISRDITERTRAAHAVAAAQGTLQRILDSITDGLAVLDRDWRYTYFSETAAKMLGVRADDLLGKTVWEMFPAADELLFGREYRRAMETGVPTHFEEYYPEPLNTWLELHCYPSADGLSVFFREINDRKRIEEEKAALLANEKRLRAEAEEAIEAKDRLLAAVSHELRNPLTALSGWLQVLDGEVDPEMRALAFRSMRGAVAAQKRMIDDLLDTVRFARGTVAIVQEHVDMAQVAAEIVATMRPVASESGIDLQSITHIPTPILGDRGRIAQVVANLVSNALKFTPPEGRVTVRVERRGQNAVLEVVDTGHGIAPDFLPRVFERFTQERTHTAHGLGLGLAIVRDIVEQHGGTVHAASEGVGRGTTFTVELPLGRKS